MFLPKNATGHILFVQPPEFYSKIDLELLKEEIKIAYMKYDVQVEVFFGKAIIHTLGIETAKNYKINTSDSF